MEHVSELDNMIYRLNQLKEIIEFENPKKSRVLRKV
jgi:hypothetical protein